MTDLNADQILSNLTHRARIRPSLPHGQRQVWDVIFVRLDGWYPVTATQARYLEKQPANEGNPDGEKLFDAKTIEEAAEIDVRERRSARSGGSALNPVGLDGVVPPEKADRSTADLIARVEESEARASAAERHNEKLAADNATQGTLLQLLAAKLGVDLATLGAPAASEPIPKEPAKPEEAVPAKPARPGAVPRQKAPAPSSAASSTDAAHAPETPASEG